VLERFNHSPLWPDKEKQRSTTTQRAMDHPQEDGKASQKAVPTNQQSRRTALLAELNQTDMTLAGP